SEVPDEVPVPEPGEPNLSQVQPGQPSLGCVPRAVAPGPARGEVPQWRADPMQLRPYQQAAIDAVYDHLRRRDDNPCAVIPTAGGKTPVMATICKDAVGTWGGRVLILAHVKELLQQTADKLQMVCPEVNFGVY